MNDGFRKVRNEDCFYLQVNTIRMHGCLLPLAPKGVGNWAQAHLSGNASQLGKVPKVTVFIFM